MENVFLIKAHIECIHGVTAATKALQGHAVCKICRLCRSLAGIRFIWKQCYKQLYTVYLVEVLLYRSSRYSNWRESHYMLLILSLHSDSAELLSKCSCPPSDDSSFLPWRSISRFECYRRPSHNSPVIIVIRRSAHTAPYKAAVLLTASWLSRQHCYPEPTNYNRWTRETSLAPNTETHI